MDSSICRRGASAAQDVNSDRSAARLIRHVLRISRWILRAPGTMRHGGMDPDPEEARLDYIHSRYISFTPTCMRPAPRPRCASSSCSSRILPSSPRIASRSHRASTSTRRSWRASWRLLREPMDPPPHPPLHPPLHPPPLRPLLPRPRRCPGKQRGRVAWLRVDAARADRDNARVGCNRPGPTAARTERGNGEPPNP